MKPATSIIHNLAPSSSEPILLNIQPHVLVMSESFQTTWTFDREGRLVTGFCRGANYLQALDGRVMMKRRAEGEQPKTRSFLSPEQINDLVDTIHSSVTRIRDLLPSKGLDEAHPHLLPWFDTILAWDARRIIAEQERFSAIYKPVGILPPDQYRSVVLQATEGCTWNHCTFCSFYRNRPFTVPSVPVFRQHVQQVKAFLGKSIGVRKSLFLADANALALAQTHLLERMRIIHEAFSIGAPRPGDDYVLDGIYAFLDIFGAERKSSDDYRALKELHVRRVYIGLETGDEPLFRLLNKPGSPSACVDVVQTIKEAGINVGIILLAGAGGADFAQRHVQHSLEALSRMGLDRGDIVYLSPLIVSDESDYTSVMQQHNISSLSPHEVMEQVHTLQAAVKTACPGRPRVTRYHIQEFLY